MTSHHDVAGVVAELRTVADRIGASWAFAPLRQAADLLESQAKALSETERTSCGDWASQRENDALTIEMYNWKARALAAETRLEEAMGILEFYAEPFEYIKKHGLEEQTPDFYDELDTGARARDFLNAAKEKT